MITLKKYDSSDIYRDTDNWTERPRFYKLSDNSGWVDAWIQSPLSEHIEKNLGYRVLIISDEDGGFVAEIPTLPGCITEGETIDDVMDYLKDALTGWLEVAKSRDLEIPSPDNMF